MSSSEKLMSIFGKSRNEKGHEVRQFMTARYRDDGHCIVADHLLSSLAQLFPRWGAQVLILTMKLSK